MKKKEEWRETAARHNRHYELYRLWEKNGKGCQPVCSDYETNLFNGRCRCGACKMMREEKCANTVDASEPN